MTIREPAPAAAREPIMASASVATVQPQPEPRLIEPVAAEAAPSEGGLDLAAEIKPVFTRDAPLTLDIKSQGDLYEAPAAIEPERTAAKAEPEAEEEGLLLHGRLPLGDESRQKNGGWLSLFGGRTRHDQSPPPLRDYRGDPTPVLQARAAASAQAALQPAPEAQAEAGEDLEIPSFLRRLAN
jgi:cell division protein FtsZ